MAVLKSYKCEEHGYFDAWEQACPHCDVEPKHIQFDQVRRGYSFSGALESVSEGIAFDRFRPVAIIQHGVEWVEVL